MKLSKKDESLLLIVAGVIIIVLVYFFGCKKLDEKTTALQNENNSLQAVITKMELHQSKLSFYKEETARMNEECVEIKNTYPSAILSADKILYAKRLEDVCNMHISYLGMSDVTTVNVAYPTAQLISVDAQLNGQAQPMTPANPNGIYLMKHGLSVNYEAGYENLKQLFNFIIEDSQQKSLHSVTLSYNESTGVLSGNMTSSMYSMTGTSVVYQKPDFTGIATGTDDLFKTFSELDEGETESEED